MAYLGIGTISVGSTETGFTQTVSAIGATMMMISVGSTETGFTVTRNIAGLNTNASISIANSTTAYSAPYILNNGVTETVQFSGIASVVSYGSSQISLSTVQPIWKNEIFTGAGTTGGGTSPRPSVGQVFPRGF